MSDEEGEENEVTLFRPAFSRAMLLQKAEDAGFFVALDAPKWDRLLALLAERNVGFFHAGTDAAKVIATAHGRDKDMVLRLREQKDGTQQQPSA